MTPWNLPLRALKYARNVYAMGRQAQEQCDVSFRRMMGEHWRLRKLNELRIGEYFGFGLFDPAMEWERKTEYIGQRLMRRLWSALNPIEYRYIFKDKLIFKRLCLHMGLPTADLLGVFDPDWGYEVDGQPLRTAEDLAAWIRRLEDPNVVFKPTAGAEGQMIRAFCDKTESPEPALLDLEGARHTADELYEYFTDYDRLEEACSGAPEISPTFLIEERLRPHPDLARLSPETLCTLRLVTLRDREMGVAPQIVAAAYKLQTERSGADNIARGAMAISVDCESGRLGTGWIKPHAGEVPTLKRYEEAPGTGVRFTGLMVPAWEEARDLALRAAAAFPCVRAVGWDVAVTPDGPRLLEGNWAWCEKLAQGGGGRGIYRGDFKAVCDRLRAEGKADKELV